MKKKDPFIIGKKKFFSRLIVGTGKYKNMSECAKAIKISGADLVTVAVRRVNISDKSKLTLFKAVGCPECRQTGYRGRTGVFELMPIDDDIRECMVRGITSGKIREVARQKGMRSMREDGIQKMASGITTIDEVMRVTSDRS